MGAGALGDNVNCLEVVGLAAHCGPKEVERNGIRNDNVHSVDATRWVNCATFIGRGYHRGAAILALRSGCGGGTRAARFAGTTLALPSNICPAAQTDVVRLVEPTAI